MFWSKKKRDEKQEVPSRWSRAKARAKKVFLWVEIGAVVLSAIAVVVLFAANHCPQCYWILGRIGPAESYIQIVRVTQVTHRSLWNLGPAKEYCVVTAKRYEYPKDVYSYEYPLEEAASQLELKTGDPAMMDDQGRFQKLAHRFSRLGRPKPKTVAMALDFALPPPPKPIAQVMDMIGNIIGAGPEDQKRQAAELVRGQRWSDVEAGAKAHFQKIPEVLYEGVPDYRTAPRARTRRR